MLLIITTEWVAKTSSLPIPLAATQPRWTQAKANVSWREENHLCLMKCTTQQKFIPTNKLTNSTYFLIREVTTIFFHLQGHPTSTKERQRECKRLSWAPVHCIRVKKRCTTLQATRKGATQISKTTSKFRRKPHPIVLSSRKAARRLLSRKSEFVSKSLKVQK